MDHTVMATTCILVVKACIEGFHTMALHQYRLSNDGHAILLICIIITNDITSAESSVDL